MIDLQNLLRGFLTILPILSAILITIFALSIVHYVSVKIAENHIVKHHLPELADIEIKELREETARLKEENKTLREERILHIKTLSGIRYLLRKGE